MPDWVGRIQARVSPQRGVDCSKARRLPLPGVDDLQMFEPAGAERRESKELRVAFLADPRAREVIAAKLRSAAVFVEATNLIDDIDNADV